LSKYTIHLKNDKSYPCDENTSLLRAALDNDISLEYSCFEARCRSCRVKILQGKVENLQDEKVLTAEEKAAGYVLSCNVVPRSEVILDVEDLAVKLPKPQVTPCKINNITVLTPNIVEVVLRLPPKVDFQFLAGQYIDIIRNGQKRSYSINHSQCEANELRLFIRNYEGGLFSQYWFNEAKPNDLLRMEGPLGTFFYRNNPNCEEIVLIATGASSTAPNIPGLDEVDYLTSTSLLELKKVPNRLTVIGSGYIGMELGQLFHNLGSEVTLIQRSERLLKEYDPEISEAITKALTEQGINLVTGATYERVEQDGDIKKVHVEINGKKRIIEAEQLLIATGRKPNTESLNLHAAGVEVGSRGEIVIDDYLKTTNSRIYSAGDVTLGPQFVYVAAYEGGLAARNAIGGLNQKVNLEVVPGVTFTSPSIATVGLTEQQAKEKGYEVKTSVLPLDAVPRALVNRETTGVFKLVADAKTLKVLGAHVVAENAGDVIYAATLAVKFGLTVGDLRETMAPYLTMAEGLKLAVLTFDKDVSKLSCCAG